MPSIFSEHSLSKSNAYKRSWSNFNKEKFTLDYLEKDGILSLMLKKMMLIIHLTNMPNLKR